jgi:UDP-GlcNAc:undecaprenyl-phosphate GlcNAc-1-phosphate transferase
MGIHVNFIPNCCWKDILEALITAVWLVGITNAYNYLDGLDGLAAGSAAINLFCFSVILYMTGQYPLGLLAISLIASCIAFLPYNFQKRKIFLGEAGSTFMGFMLAGISLIGNWAGDNAVKLSVPILVLGVPIFDMIFTTIMRIKEGKVRSLIEWLRYGGKDHFHHYLVDLGLKPLGSVLFIYCVTLSLGISAIVISKSSAIAGFLGIIQASIILGMIGILIVAGKKHRNHW